jgi:mRNA interferase MazF
MKKDFQKWHAEKEKVNAVFRPPLFQEREVWFSSLGANVGFEQDGQGERFLRPIVVVRKFNQDIFWAIPLTRTEKRTAHYFPFSFDEHETSVAILSQIRLFDARRLVYRIGFMSEKDFYGMMQKFEALLPRIFVTSAEAESGRSHCCPSSPRFHEGSETRNGIPGHGDREPSLPGSVDPVSKILPDSVRKSSDA